MSKEQYNSLDDWFRAAADQPGPPVNDAAWQAMEARLDGQKKRRRAIFWWWFSGLFITGAIVMVARMNFEPVDNKPNATVEVPANSSSAAAGKPSDGQSEILPHPGTDVAGIKRPDGNNAESPIEAISTSEQKTGKKLATVTLPENGEKASIGRKAFNEQKSTVSSTKQVTLALKKKTPGYNKQASYKPAPASRNVLPVTTVAVASTPGKNSESDNEISGKEQPVTSDSLAVDSAVVQKDKTDQPVIVSKDSTSQNKSVKSPVRPTHFYVFGGLAPEWSYVKNRGTNEVSLSYGIGIGYSFSKKWAIQTGVFLAGKKYVAGEGDYTPKKGSYYDNPYIKIESVDADCAVLEIPLSVRYTFLQNKKFNLFAIAGVASTVMKEENYAYDYSRYGNPAYSHYTYKTGAFSLFSTASFSVGLERPVNKHFSLLVAPYFNFPLNGIGEGKVYINSFGIMGGLKYNLPF